MISVGRTARQEHSSTNRLNWHTAWISFFTAVIGAAAVFLPTQPKINDLSDSADSLSAENSALQAELESTRGELAAAKATNTTHLATIDDLRSENSELRTLVPPEIDPQEAHDIRAAGTIKLAADGDTIDLNSTLDNFGASDTYLGQDSLTYDGETLNSGYGMSSLDLGDTAASYETCAVATGYQEQSAFEPHRLRDGTVCLRLASDRYAKVEVKRYDENSATVAVTVWD